jgi:hypothetical protein
MKELLELIPQEHKTAPVYIIYLNYLIESKNIYPGEIKKTDALSQDLKNDLKTEAPHDLFYLLILDKDRSTLIYFEIDNEQDHISYAKNTYLSDKRYFIETGIVKDRLYPLQISLLQSNLKPISLTDLDKMNKEDQDDFIQSSLEIIAFIKLFFIALSNKQTRLGNIDINYRIKNPNNPKKKINIEQNVTYIKPLNGSIPSLKSKNIEWKHSWYKRGHWREISSNSIGKDKYGNRNQVGRTWISATRVNSHLPLKNKLRIMQPRR